jgi:hypothetical protein
MFFDNTIINIFFDKKMVKPIHKISMKPNLNIDYYNNSHLNYIYNYSDDETELEYTFYGFYKDDYLVILYDTYNIKLDVKIEHKHIYLIKVNWILKEHNNITLWAIDTSKKYKTECVILSCRKNFFLENITINDILKINNYRVCEVVIKSFQKKNLFHFF